MGASEQPTIGPLALADWVQRARRRLGIAHGLSVLCQAGLWLLPLLTLVRFVLLRQGSDLTKPAVATIALCLLLGAAFLVGYLKRPSRLASAVLLDQRVGASGSVAALFELGKSDHGGYVDLLQRQAARHLAEARLARALPLPRPSALGPFAILLAGFACTLAIEPRVRSVARLAQGPAATTTTSGALALPEEELSLLARRAERLLSTIASQEGRQRALEFAELVRQLESGALDQKQALSAVAALEREIQDEPSSDRAADPAAADRAGAESSGMGEKGRKAEDEAEALRRLAERLAQETSPPTARELDQIRKSLEEAREQNRQEHEAARAQAAKTEQRLRDKERRLLAKKDAGELSKNEEAELEQTKRQLERLDRQKKTEAEETSELDRQLAEALRELQGDPKKAGEFLERAADGAGQAENRKLSDAEKRELLEQLRALKERLRQGEKEELTDQLRQFERRARGGGQGEGQGEGQGKPGGGVSLVPRGARGAGQAGQRDGTGESGTAVEAGAGTSADPGSHHDPNWQGEATPSLDAKLRDTAAAARDTGEGASESETILTAAEEGFRAGAYEKLYKDYQTVLEEMVRGETIPRARRTEVERYFDLIRPRND